MSRKWFYTRELNQDYFLLTAHSELEECEGIGHNLNVDPNLVISDKNKSIEDGVIEPWAKSTSLYYAQTLASIAKHYKGSLDKMEKTSKNSRYHSLWFR